MTAVEFIEPLTHEEGVSQATKLFVDTYGAAPEGVWAAPGRVNLIGEHTDYNAGLCLPIALPHRTFIALKPREDTKVRVVSDVAPDKVAEADLDGLKARGVDGWSAYPTGVAWALRQAGFDKVKGFDAAFVSCVPLGSGLSSSAAMTCSTALALDDVYGLGYGDSDAGRVTLINAAIKSENEMAGASTGGLDQSASMRCTEGHALLLDCRPELTPLENVSQQEFDLDKYNLELLVVDTQAPHQLNDGQYAQRRATCEQAAKILGVANLRVTADGIAKADDPFQALKETLDALLPVLEKLGVVCGVSSPFTNLYDANHAWFQASAALQNGLSQGGTIFRFQDYLLPQLLSGALAGRPTWVYYTEGLKRLKEHDDNSQVSYLHTLRVYLDNNLSVTKTASALFLHRSTLLDRLAHITAMLGSDLKDPDYCLTLGIILRAELEQKRTEQGAPA